jgi:hypothetical protein
LGADSQVRIIIVISFLFACFVVGLFLIMLFSREGRGCLGSVFGLIIAIVAIIALGGAVILGAIYLISSL